MDPEPLELLNETAWNGIISFLFPAVPLLLHLGLYGIRIYSLALHTDHGNNISIKKHIPSLSPALSNTLIWCSYACFWIAILWQIELPTVLLFALMISHALCLHLLRKIPPKVSFRPNLRYVLSQIMQRLSNKPSKPQNKENIMRELEQVLEESDSPRPLEDRKLLRDIVRFSDLQASQIMTPMQEVVSVKTSFTFDQLKNTLIKNGFSRMPVFNDQGILEGILHAKDLVGVQNDDFIESWKELIRPALLIDQHKKIKDLLQEFRQRHKHIAVVTSGLDHYVGLISLEDIVEEIVGEISDEFDDPEPSMNQISENTYLIDGMKKVRDVISFDPDFFHSLNELPGELSLQDALISIHKQFPSRRDEIQWHNLAFNIEAIDKKRVLRVKVSRR